MPLPTPNLDDLRFQRDLVDEARKRIIRYCPEWTDYNLSDPGVTLIELFSWMTEMMVYRLNRVPEKNYLKFLEMMGIRLRPASSARTELTFYLSVPFPIAPQDETTAIVPQGLEVTTRPTEEEREITFTTDEKLVLRRPRLVQLRRENEFNKNHLSRLGIEIFHPFDEQGPKVGDTFYLGFDEEHDITGYIMRLTFTCEETKAVGIRREDPPLVWECSTGDGTWQEVPLSMRPGERDTTGGLNNPHGSLTLYLPLSMRPGQVHGRNAYWLRCRLEPRSKEQGMYAKSPRIQNVTAYALGATGRATHAVVIRAEELGRSDGDPGQTFQVRNVPVLALRSGETVEVEEKREGELVWIPWELVSDFSDSTRYDRHFCLDEATGQVSFGPAVRQPDGSVRQYGRVPESGSRIRFSQYRQGGGTVGNVPAGRIEMLSSAVPYIDRVTNLKRAEGGRDQETVEEAKMRAARELRAQQRAVTGEDFENLGKAASRAIARVKCLQPGADGRAQPAAGGQMRLPPGMVELLVVPAAFDGVQAGDLSSLTLEVPLQEELLAYLDRFRLLTTTLRVREPCYVGIKVQAEIAISEYSQPETVRGRVVGALHRLLSPLALGDDSENEDGLLGPGWEGWPFGQDLYVSQLYSLIQQVPGVKHVLDVRVSHRLVVPSRELLLLDEEEAEAGEPEGSSEEELIPVEERALPVAADTLLCSLDHEVRVVEL
jgi:predicted phage baseplate assembly protein